MHKKCRIGETGSRDSEGVYVTFPRTNGDPDPEGGKHDDERKKILNVKYEEEVRMMLGVMKKEEVIDEETGATVEVCVKLPFSAFQSARS